MSKRVVLVGLGATGVAMARSFVERNDLQVVGAADKNPQAVGSDLGDVLGVGPLGVVVVDDPAKLPEAEIAVVATTSDLNQVAQTLLPLVNARYNVMSICEELSFPWASHAEVSRQIDDAAKANGVTVLGTGANPGVLMDTLPLLLTVLTQNAKRVTIRRRTNMSRYGAILQKFGLGLTPDAFETAQAAGEVVGHYGFEQAIGAVASGLGWELDEIEVDNVTPALLAQDVHTGAHMSIEPGQIAAVTHAARGLVNGKAVVDLEIMFGFFTDGDTIQAGDDYRIEGEEQVLDLSSSVGFESFLSTIAAAVNTAAAVVDARPGLLSMGDLPVRELASKGSRLLGVQR